MVCCDSVKLCTQVCVQGPCLLEVLDVALAFTVFVGIVLIDRGLCNLTEFMRLWRGKEQLSGQPNDLLLSLPHSISLTFSDARAS